VIALRSNLYNGPHHDLSSDVECQVFSGNKKRTQASDRAVRETHGLILAEDGKPINAYYASNCGGHSELIKIVWPERQEFKSYQTAAKDDDKRQQIDLSSEKAARNWIDSNPEVYCNPTLGTELPAWSQKNFRWKRRIHVDSLSKMISTGKDLGRLSKIKFLNRGLSGRIYNARFIFEQDSFDVKGELAVRQLWQPSLRSACFVVDKEGDYFIIRGAGWGHGVGLCQSGALVQAKQGKPFLAILKHYYQKADLVQLYETRNTK
jgi:SpoIID/LytB domain protein